MNIKVSVIIPIYNRTYCLARCLDSVLFQTFTDWECILIDDGSTDGSLSVCRHYAETDSRFRVYSQSNSGASVARNRGVELARGQYIAFIDSDDWVERTYLQLLYDAVGEDTMSFCGQDEFDSQGVRSKEMPVKSDESFLLDNSGADLIAYYFFDSKLLFGPVNKLYARKIIEDYHIRFPVGIDWGEDTIFNYTYYSHVSKLKGVPFTLYHVMKQKVSLTTEAKYDYFLSDSRQKRWDGFSDFLQKKGLNHPRLMLVADNYYIYLFCESTAGSIFVHDRLSWIERYKRMRGLVMSADRSKFKKYIIRPGSLAYKSVAVYFRLPVLLFLFYEIKYLFLKIK